MFRYVFYGIESPTEPLKLDIWCRFITKFLVTIEFAKKEFKDGVKVNDWILLYGSGLIILVDVISWTILLNNTVSTVLPLTLT
jgi:hypothetical protein